MSIATVTLAVGTTAAVTLTDNVTTYVPPGVSVTVALLSSTGISRWHFRADNVVGGSDPQGSLSGLSYTSEGGATPFSYTFVMPFDATSIVFVSEALDASKNPVKNKVTLSAFQGAAGGTQYHKAAVVNTSNVNTSSMNVVIDGQTLTQGQTVLLVAQTTGAQNGLYTVGAVAANLAALTIAADLPTGLVATSPVIVEVEAGTLYGGTTWKSTNTGSLTVGTTALTFYPRTFRGAANLASNTVNVTSLWIVTGATVVAVSTNLNATAQVSTVTAGAGTGNIIIQGANAGGTGAYVYLGTNWG